MDDNCRKRVFWQLSTVLLITAFGCADDGRRVRKQPPAEEYKIDRKELGDEAWEIAKTFENYDRIRESLRSGDDFELYEGLPHTLFEPDLYKSELANAKIVRVAGTPFYAEPMQAAMDETRQLREMLGDRNSFVPFRGFKACGGFHTDWCLVWKRGKDSYSAELCFGCHELMVYQNDERILHGDIWDCKKFEKLLKPLRTNRPVEKIK